MKFRFTILFLLLLFSAAKTQIVFSEVMFDVPGPDYDNEFVEFFNCSDSAVNLKGWYFSDSSAMDAIVDAGWGTILLPDQFAVLLDGSYFGRSTVYDTLIPPQALILRIEDRAFGQNGLSNTHAERLSLINASGREVATYRYSTDNKPGFSDEKIRLCAGDDVANWANSLRLWGTPGFKNSVTPYPYDLALPQNALRFKPESAVKKGQTVYAELTYCNVGLRTFDDSVRFLVFADFNHDEILQSLEPILLQRQFEVRLNSGNTGKISFAFTADFSGILSLVAMLSAKKDQNHLNNSAICSLVVMDMNVPLKINEIKFLTQKGEPEWVEIFNAGNTPVNLRDWALADATDTARIGKNCNVSAKGFKVLCADSGLTNFYAIQDSSLCVLTKMPKLNNDADILYLLAPWNDWVEQVRYRKSWLWGEEGRLPSLERINPSIDARLERNWGPSVNPNGATPGKVNSLYAPLKFSKLHLTVAPNPFSPNEDGFEDNAIIMVRLPAKAARVRATLYDVLGRKIITLSAGHLSGQETQLIWNGRDERKKYVRSGIYILFVQIIDDRNGILQEAKTTIDLVR